MCQVICTAEPLTRLSKNQPVQDSSLLPSFLSHFSSTCLSSLIAWLSWVCAFVLCFGLIYLLFEYHKLLILSIHLFCVLHKVIENPIQPFCKLLLYHFFFPNKAQVLSRFSSKIELLQNISSFFKSFPFFIIILMYTVINRKVYGFRKSIL